MLATMLWSVDDLAGAERHLRRSLEHARRIENEPQIARALSLLAMLATGRSPPDSATSLLREAGEIVARGRYRTEATFFLAATAGALLERGDAQGAAETVSMCESVRRDLGMQFAPILGEFVASVSSAAARTAMGQIEASPHSVFAHVSGVLERLAAPG